MPNLAHFARVAPFASYILLLALNPLLAEPLGPVLTPWLYGLQIGVAGVLLLLYWPHYAELHRATLRQEAPCAREWVYAFVLGVAVFVMWINLDLPGLSFAQERGSPPPQVDGAWSLPWLALRIAGAALVVPLMEELFWRSWVMRWMDERDFLRLQPAQASLRAVLVSSVAFGLEHSLWAAGILAGLAYAWLYRRGSLWLPVLAHAVTNLLLGLWVVATEQWQFW